MLRREGVKEKKGQTFRQHQGGNGRGRRLLNVKFKNTPTRVGK